MLQESLFNKSLPTQRHSGIFFCSTNLLHTLTNDEISTYSFPFSSPSSTLLPHLAGDIIFLVSAFVMWL